MQHPHFGPPRGALSLLGALVLAACSAAPGSSSSSATATATTAAGGERVASYLESLYRAKDVRHSFRSVMGDDVDCVDLTAEPGVRTLLAQGMSLDEITEPFETEAAAKQTEAPTRHEAYFNGEEDESGHLRACPEGSVAHVRVTAEQIDRAGGLDLYLASMRKTASPKETRTVGKTPELSPIEGGMQASDGNYAWVQDVYGPSTKGTIQSGITTMTIASPWLTPASAGHSVSQVWMESISPPPAAMRQTVEAGWIAVPGATAALQPPRLFIFSTADDYNHWCFNGGTASTCVPWVPNTAATLTPGALLPASVRNGTQHELTITVTHMPFFCRLGTVCPHTYRGWGVYAKVDNGANVLLGYYANSGFATAAIPNGLATAADNFSLGGEVYDATKTFTMSPAVTMGEGSMFLGTASYGNTAYHRDFGYWDNSNAFIQAGSVIHDSNPEYIHNLTAAAGQPSWTYWFYYGDWYFHYFPLPITQ